MAKKGSQMASKIAIFENFNVYILKKSAKIAKK